MIDGLGQALQLAVKIKDGGAVQSNFHNYQLPRMPMIPPVIDVEFVKSDATTPRALANRPCRR